MMAYVRKASRASARQQQAQKQYLRNGDEFDFSGV